MALLHTGRQTQLFALVAELLCLFLRRRWLLKNVQVVSFLPQHFKHFASCISLLFPSALLYSGLHYLYAFSSPSFHTIFPSAFLPSLCLFMSPLLSSRVLFFFNWRIIALQCCVSFWCTRKSAVYTYIHPLPRSPPLTHPHPTPLGCHGVPSWGPCAYSSFPLAICSTYGSVYMSVSSRVLDQSLRQQDKVSELPWAGETFHPAEVNVTKGISHYLGTHSPLAQCREGGPEFFPHRNIHYQNSHFL